MNELTRLTAAVEADVEAVGAPASAATTTFRAATITMAVTSLSPDRAVVEANCPEGFADRGALFITSEETVDVESEVYTGSMHTVSDHHCSVPGPPESVWTDGLATVTPIELEAGHMVLATPAGDRLSLDYRAPGVIKGDLLGANTHTFSGPYTVTGGTGLFTGATGRGRLDGEVQATGTGFTGGWRLNGTLHVPT